MNIKVSIIVVLLLIGMLPLFSSPIPEGTWRQTSSTAGDCASCAIDITYKAPHLIEIIANNGWVGYAYYDKSKNIYQGFLELTKKPAMKIKDWRGMVMKITLTYEGNTVTIDAYKTDSIFMATYRHKK